MAIVTLHAGDASAMCMKDDCSNDPDAWAAMMAGIGSPEDIAQTRKGIDELIDAKLPAARAVLSRSLLDYPSARFGDVRAMGATREGVALCGVLNSKNAAGRYVGWQVFVLIVDETPSLLLGERPLLAAKVAELCGYVEPVNSKDYSADLVYGSR